jgi:hypothetical protein
LEASRAGQVRAVVTRRIAADLFDQCARGLFAASDSDLKKEEDYGPTLSDSRLDGQENRLLWADRTIAYGPDRINLPQPCNLPRWILHEHFRYSRVR